MCRMIGCSSTMPAAPRISRASRGPVERHLHVVHLRHRHLPGGRAWPASLSRPSCRHRSWALVISVIIHTSFCWTSWNDAIGFAELDALLGVLGAPQSLARHRRAPPPPRRSRSAPWLRQPSGPRSPFHPWGTCSSSGDPAVLEGQLGRDGGAHRETCHEYRASRSPAFRARPDSRRSRRRPPWPHTNRERSAIDPFVIHSFVPFKTYESPWRRARVFMPPGVGARDRASVRPKPAHLLAARHRREPRPPSAPPSRRCRSGTSRAHSAPRPPSAARESPRSSSSMMSPVRDVC